MNPYEDSQFSSFSFFHRGCAVCDWEMRKKATKKIINHRRNKHYKKRNQFFFFLINRYRDCNFSKNQFLFFDKSLPRLQLLLFPFLSPCEIEAMKKIPKENQIKQTEWERWPKIITNFRNQRKQPSIVDKRTNQNKNQSKFI